MKRTKIVCTMGPNLDKPEVMKTLIQTGMDVARFNFSHGDHAEHKERMDMLKKLRKEMKVPVAILLDTKGPEIRTGLLKDGKRVQLQEGQTFVLTTEEMVGDADKVFVTYSELPRDVRRGDRILIDDGLVELHIEEVSDTDIVCTVINGGELGERKGINVPNVSVNLPAITDKDKEDILFGIEQGVDFIAASFVRKAEDVLEIKDFLMEHGGTHIAVIAKIEAAEGVKNIDSIIDVADGIMVARGDLGVEIPPYQVPHIQKTIIEKCNHRYLPVITATQMLDSMMRNPRPTRAEVADVANAIYDGTDAVMLSGETAMGKYPVEAVEMMVQIAVETEHYLKFDCYRDAKLAKETASVSSAVGFAAVDMVDHIGATCIVTPTMTGTTARLISKLRPSVPIYAVTPHEWARRQMQLFWGVKPVEGYEEDSTENIISHAMYMVLREKLVHKGDMVIFTAGDPSTNMVNGKGNVTNMLHIIQAK
ncbi:pyruvate kinase [Novisyntrophococcus fermenticellae]|uniref:pyruvate kinase n=1 Tax=Novisyntrophococcus fermenticellae TaxID=2068655 RepID=UPI001E357EF8|nr:pyruvate kinase [Novisyntrophococcus fermenticellae]